MLTIHFIGNLAASIAFVGLVAIYTPALIGLFRAAGWRSKAIGILCAVALLCVFGPLAVLSAARAFNPEACAASCLAF